MCKRCNKHTSQTYDVIKNIEVIESNSKYINNEFRIEGLCENCIRLMFVNHRDKMISYLEILSYFDDMKRNLKDDLKGLRDGNSEFSDYEVISMKINWIKDIKNKLKGLIL